MIAMASQITSLTIVYSTVYSRRRSKNHQSSASLAFVRGIHRWPVNSPHRTKGQWRGKFDDVIMCSMSQRCSSLHLSTSFMYLSLLFLTTNFAITDGMRLWGAGDQCDTLKSSTVSPSKPQCLLSLKTSSSVLFWPISDSRKYAEEYHLSLSCILLEHLKILLWNLTVAFDFTDFVF